jgi:uncharacterized protein YcgI (DUF1989 family)
VGETRSLRGGDPIGDTIHVPAREGRAVNVPQGTGVRIIDLEGNQVADVFAFNAADVSEYHSAMHTRAGVSRLFPQAGEAFMTNRRRPIMTLERDDTPAVHDMLIAPCDPERYQELGVSGWHPSCRENLEIAMRELGHDGICHPASINLFMNIPVGSAGELGWDPAPTAPGDSITLRAEMDCIIVVSACPQDIIPINDRDPTPIGVELLD